MKKEFINIAKRRVCIVNNKIRSNIIYTDYTI